MSRHEGVSCDSCLRGNFRGRRYKCLICFDYDLCSACYESGAATTHHSNSHAMQCILTRSDHELFYGGEQVGGASDGHSSHSYTCPFCAKPGFTEMTLVDHVTSQHPDTSTEVVCPICASLQGGDPNHQTNDFPVHLTLEHRSGNGSGGSGFRQAARGGGSGGNGPSDLISFLDEPGGSGVGSGSGNGNGSGEQQRTVRGPGGVRRVGRGALGSGTARARRIINQHNPNNPPPPPVLSDLAPSAMAAAAAAASSGAAVDPITELLSQLYGVRRSASSSSSSSQLQQLQMQLQYAAASNHASAVTSRQEQRLARQEQRATTRSRLGFSSSGSSTVGPSSNNLSGSVGLLPGFVASSSPQQFSATDRHQQQSSNLQVTSVRSESSSSVSSGVFNLGSLAGALHEAGAGAGAGAGSSSQFLLRQLSDEETGDETQRAEAALTKARKSCFVQELVLSTLLSEQSAAAAATAASGSEPPEIKPSVLLETTEPSDSDEGHDQDQENDHDEGVLFGVPEVDKTSVSSSDSSLYLS